MAGLGDLDADGRPDFAVAAFLQDVSGNVDQGRVFVFSGATGALLHTLDDPQPQAGARFGVAVARVGDIDGDGREDIAAGAYLQDVGSNADAGLVFIFSGRTGALLQTLDNPSPQPSALFGLEVAGLGDIDGDGRPDFSVAAVSQDVGGNTDQGRVFVFSGLLGLVVGIDIKPGSFPNSINRRSEGTK